MALFGNKKNTQVKTEKKDPAAVAVPATSAATSVASVIKHARITEKASDVQAQGAYVFDVAERATKRDIARAITAIYKVVPRKIAIINMKTKTIRSMRTGRAGVKGGGKKAYVYLKGSDTITL